MQEQNTPDKMPTRQFLLNLIENFIAQNPTVSAEGFGWLACRNSGLVERLRKGRDTSTGNFDKCIAFLQNPHQSRKSYGANRKRKNQSE